MSRLDIPARAFSRRAACQPRICTKPRMPAAQIRGFVTPFVDGPTPRARRKKRERVAPLPESCSLRLPPVMRISHASASPNTYIWLSILSSTGIRICTRGINQLLYARPLPLQPRYYQSEVSVLVSPLRQKDILSHQRSINQIPPILFAQSLQYL